MPVPSRCSPATSLVCPISPRAPQPEPLFLAAFTPRFLVSLSACPPASPSSSRHVRCIIQRLLSMHREPPPVPSALQNVPAPHARPPCLSHWGPFPAWNGMGCEEEPAGRCWSVGTGGRPSAPVFCGVPAGCNPMGLGRPRHWSLVQGEQPRGPFTVWVTETQPPLLLHPRPRGLWAPMGPVPAPCLPLQAGGLRACWSGGHKTFPVALPTPSASLLPLGTR